MRDGQVRIFVASNSQGTSAGVPLGRNYPALLQDLLGPGYCVSGLLISGWSVKDFAQALNDNVLAFCPTIVVAQFGIIEATERILSAREKRTFAAIPFGYRLTEKLFEKRSMILWLRRRLGIATRVMSITDFRLSVADVHARLRERGIECLFLRMPPFADEGRSLKHPFMNENIAPYNSVLDEYGAISIDEAGSGWTSDCYQHGSVHFTAEGHRVTAEVLARHVLALVAQERFA